MDDRMKQAAEAKTFIAENVTCNGIERSGLRSGDYIRSNNSMTALIKFICGDLITVEDEKGTLMNITSDNKIDLIC